MLISDRMENMKTVLFISPTGTFDNGAEISIFNLMCYLVRQNYQVINIAPNSDQAQQGDYIQRCEKNGIKVEIYPALKWWWESAPGGLPGSEVERAFYYRDTIGRIRAAIRSYHVDVVFTNTVNMFQGVVAAACEAVPHYYLIHEFPENEFAYYLDKIDFIDENTDEIFAVTGALCTELSEKFKSHQVKSFTPFTEIQGSELIPGEETRLVSVGRLTKRKNQLELIKAYQKLDHPDVELVFIGAWDDNYKTICDAYIKDNQIKGILFTGQLEKPWEDITSQDICIFTSQMETFGLVYVEAILNGIPVIFSNNPGHLSAYDLFKVGQVYQLGEITELSQMIQESLLNFKALKVVALEQVECLQKQYTVEKSYEQILETLASQKTYPPKSIRHLVNLLSTNEPKSKLSRLESKIRRKIRQFLKG